MSHTKRTLSLATVLAMSIGAVAGSTAGAKAEGDERVAVHKEAPKYPRGAERRKIGGHVLLEITVLADGTVSDATVVEAQPPGVFDDAAVRAAKKWKYKSAEADTSGTNMKFTFAL